MGVHRTAIQTHRRGSQKSHPLATVRIPREPSVVHRLAQPNRPTRTRRPTLVPELQGHRPRRPGPTAPWRGLTASQLHLGAPAPSLGLPCTCPASARTPQGRPAGVPDSPPLPPATQQPARPLKAETSARRSSALSPRTHVAGSALSSRPRVKCHLQEEASRSPALSVPRWRDWGSQAFGARRQDHRRHTGTLAKRTEGHGRPAHVPPPPGRPQRVGVTDPPRGNCLRTRPALHTCAPHLRPAPAPSCRAGGAGEARTGLTAPQLRAMTGQPDRAWAPGALWGFLQPRPRHCRLAPSCPSPGLPVLGGKVADSSAATLGGPGKSAQPPLTSRAVVHLIGCSAAGVGRLLAAGAPCMFLKPWHCKDPQALPPVLFYRRGNEPREGRRLMSHQLVEKPGLGPKGIALSSAPATAKRGRSPGAPRPTGQAAGSVVWGFVFSTPGSSTLSPSSLHPPSPWPFCPVRLLLGRRRPLLGCPSVCTAPSTEALPYPSQPPASCPSALF